MDSIMLKREKRKVFPIKMQSKEFLSQFKSIAAILRNICTQIYDFLPNMTK